MHLGVMCLMLNKLFSSCPIVMHLGVTNCDWGNFISGSVLNQSFSSGAIVTHLGPWSNSLFLGWLNRCYTNCSVEALNRSFNGQAQSPRRCSPPSMVWSLDTFFVNVRSLESEQLHRCPTELQISLKWVFLPNHCGRDTHFRRICFSVPNFNFKYEYINFKKLRVSGRNL